MSSSQSDEKERRVPHALRPTTKVLTQGFDPTLSVGSASSEAIPWLGKPNSVGRV